MQLTRYTDYSVRVLIHLATYPERQACIAEIARAFGISQSHLTKVVQDLGQSGYLETVRGRNGGIRLARQPQEINLGALVRHTEKHFDVVECADCIIAPACQMTSVFAQATRVSGSARPAHAGRRRDPPAAPGAPVCGQRGAWARRPRMKFARAVAIALVASASAALHAAAPDPRAPPSPGSEVVYDREYPFIHYSDPPERNEIARLQKRLGDGSAKLVPTAQHGYLESVLAALGIDPDSQALVFSKTSLQVESITAATPRAIYFNDDTYVGYVQHGLLEIVTMDADRGPVFYTLSPTDSTPQVTREALRCLSCHDTYGELGGGVPHFLFESTYDVQGNKLIPDAVARETTDATPIAQRWGGWYVTGADGGSLNLGNIPPPLDSTPVNIDKLRHGSMGSLATLFDTSAYLRTTSDIVALLVLEHQVTVHNELVHANYKSRVLLEHMLPDADPATLHWAQLPPQLQGRYEPMLRPLVDVLLLANSAPLPHAVTAGNDFAVKFQARGLKDTQGRSLRQLDLSTRVFRYPLSYLIYSEGFDALPLFVREHVYERLEQILRQPDPGAPYSSRPAADRQAAFDILVATKPAFASAVGTSRN